MDKEIFKQWFGQIVRCAVSYAFGVVTAHKLFPEEYAGLLLDSTVVLATAVLLQGLALFWGWAKIRYNVIFARFARSAPPETPMNEIVREVHKNYSLVTKI